jgi:hypothetical protein
MTPMDAENNPASPDLVFGADAAEPAPPSKTDDRAAKIDAAVDRWFMDFIHGSPVSRATEIYNHVYSATQTLKQRLKEL